MTLYKSVADTYKTRERFAQLDLEMFQRLQGRGFAPRVIADVGASDGSWSRDVVTVFPAAQFHLFEPLVSHAPAYGEIMAETLRLHDNFVLHPVALGATPGSVTINVFPNLVASTALDLAGAGLETRPVTVPLRTLDGMVAAGALPVPQVLKVDTQGFELAILQGAAQILPQVGVLVLECWLYRGYGPGTPLLTELAAWLLGVNFRLWDVGEPYRDQGDGLATLDCLFVNEGLGLAPDWYY